MGQRRNRLTFGVAALLSLGWILLATVWPRGGPYEAIPIGILFGTMVGQTTVAAAWTASGPGAIGFRLPVSLLWVVSLSTALMPNAMIRGEGIGLFVVTTSALLLQWALLQAPLWGLTVLYGLRLRHQEESCDSPRLGARQFGIRQLMVLTLCIGVVLGIGRILMPYAAVTAEKQVWIVFLFFTAAGAIFTLPLLLAAILPRMATLAVLLVLVLIAVATFWEMSVLNMFSGRGGSSSGVTEFGWINVFSAAWVLGFVAIVRFCGYGLGWPTQSNQLIEGSNNSSSLPSSSLTQANLP